MRSRRHNEGLSHHLATRSRGQLWVKHNVPVEEVEEVLFGEPHVRFREHSETSRALWVSSGRGPKASFRTLSILKSGSVALIISARDLDRKERRYYAKRQVSSISRSRSWEEMAEFWDTHSVADYDGQTYEVEMSFDPAAQRSAVRVEPELLADITRIARERQISTPTLVNVWLRQQVDRLTAPVASMSSP